MLRFVEEFPTLPKNSVDYRIHKNFEMGRVFEKNLYCILYCILIRKRCFKFLFGVGRVHF